MAEQVSAPSATDTIHDEKYFPDFSRKLVCIQYPGKVENVDKMLQTLGGMDNIETVSIFVEGYNYNFLPNLQFDTCCSLFLIKGLNAL